MPKAVVAGYARSPFTIANKGELISVRPEDLLSQVIKDLVIPKKTKILIAPEGESLILAQKTLKYFKKYVCSKQIR